MLPAYRLVGSYVAQNTQTASGVDGGKIPLICPYQITPIEKDENAQKG